MFQFVVVTLKLCGKLSQAKVDHLNPLQKFNKWVRGLAKWKILEEYQYKILHHTLAVMVPCFSPLLFIILTPAVWNMLFISSGVAVVAKSTSSGRFPDRRSRTAPPAILSSNLFFSNISKYHNINHEFWTCSLLVQNKLKKVIIQKFDAWQNVPYNMSWWIYYYCKMWKYH